MLGIANKLLGKATKGSNEAAQREFANILTEGETIQLVYELIRDKIIFTDLRLIFIDKQGITGRKTETFSVPYQSVTAFAVETAGTLDLDSELKLWLSGRSEPIHRDLARSVDVFEIQANLARYILRRTVLGTRSPSPPSPPTPLPVAPDVSPGSPTDPTPERHSARSSPVELLHRAKLLARQGDRAEAKATLQRLADEFPDSDEARSVAALLQK